MFRATVVYTPRLGSPPACCCSGDEPTDRAVDNLSRDERRSTRDRRGRSARERETGGVAWPQGSACPRMSRTPPDQSGRGSRRKIGGEELGRTLGAWGYWAGQRAREGDQTPASQEATPPSSTPNQPPCPLLAKFLPFPTGVFYAAWRSCRRNRRKNATRRVHSCLLLLLFPVCFGDYVVTAGKQTERLLLFYSRYIHGSVIYDTS